MPTVRKFFSGIVVEYEPVWFTETEIAANGKILIPLTETKKIMKKGNETETEKFDMETDKFGYVHIRFRCISISHNLAGFM